MFYSLTANERPTAFPDFGRSVNPISTTKGRLCPANNTGTPRIFRPSDSPAVSVGWSAMPNTLRNIQQP